MKFMMELRSIIERQHVDAGHVACRDERADE